MVPPVAMMPITMTIPLAPAGVKMTDDQDWATDPRIVVRPTMAMRSAMKTRIAALVGISSRRGGECDCNCECACDDSFHVILRVAIIRLAQPMAQALIEYPFRVTRPLLPLLRKKVRG